MKAAFIGLGNMGAAMARCILRANHDLTVWNRTAAKMQTLIDEGAKGALTAREAVAEADIVVTNLMDDRSIFDVLEANDGILVGMKPGAVHVCTATISPTCAEKLRKIHETHGTRYVSGPVVGRPDAAAAGKLTSYVAGNPAAIQEAMPVCQAYSAKVIAVSDRPSAANCMKLAINYNVAAAIELISETYVFAEKCGLPLEHMRDFYQQIWFSHPAAQMFAEKLRTRDFAGRGGFIMTGGLKDLRMMLSTASDVNAPLEVAKIIERKLAAGVDSGMGETDWSAIYEISRREAGLK